MNQRNAYNFDHNRNILIRGNSPWTDELLALEEKEVLCLGAPQEAAPPSHDSARDEPGNPSADVLRSALDTIPPDVDINTWTRLVVAVGDGATNVQTAESLLKEWSPEGQEGEYARELGEPNEAGITVATLFEIAEQNGWTPPDTSADENLSDSSSTSDKLTLADFKAVLGSFGGDANNRDVEEEALQLVEELSYLPDEQIAQAKLVLEDAGARAKEARKWQTLVNKKKEERKEKEANTQDNAGAPSNLKGGEFTSWVVDEILKKDSFAVDKGGALFYYKDGRYCKPGDKAGEKYLKRKVIDLLERTDTEEKSTTYWYSEVKERIETIVPTLWEKSPNRRICFKNGIYHLKTGKIEPLTSEWLSPDQIPITYDPDANGTAYRNFFKSMMPDDGGAELGFELVAQLVQRACKRRRAYFLVGGPNSGKSTLINVISEYLLGANASHFALQELGDKHNRACLHNKTLNVCADLPSGPMKDRSTFKRITGGDPIDARHMYKGPFSFKPNCHLLFSGNGPIRAPGAGEAFWDRWVVIPCLNDFSKGSGKHTSRKELDARLEDPREKSALLNEILPIIREGGDITQTPSMKKALDWMRQVNEDQEEETERTTKFPLQAGDGAAQEEGDPHLE